MKLKNKLCIFVKYAKALKKNEDIPKFIFYIVLLNKCRIFEINEKQEIKNYDFRKEK